MTRQSWIIGSASSCDVVVDNPTVSGRHCRLEHDGTTMSLTDLGSTNGTFVNGERLTGSCVVTTDDRVTLGQHETMPWPEAIKASGAARPSKPPAQEPAAHVVTIGRGFGNDVVLDEASVSTNHARLTISGETIVLEDLGSTNGTSVGSVENKINRSTVRASDTVYFGSAAYRVADLAAGATGSTVSPPVARAASAGSRAGWIAGAAVIVVGAVIAWMVRPGRDTDDTAGAGPAAVAEESADRRADNDPQLDPVPLSVPSPEQSLFAVVCSYDQTPMRVGTAFAIDSHHVATTVNVARSIDESQRAGQRAWLYSPRTGEEIPIAGTRLHPEYEAAAEAARRAQSEYHNLYDALEAAFEANEPAPEELDAARERLLAATMNAQEATERVANYLVAVVEVESPLEQWLPANTSATAVRPNLRLTVMGLPPDSKDHFFDTARPIEPCVMAGRVRELLPTGINARRLMAEGTAEQQDYDFQGSPVLNEQGEVVAVYSRVTPQPPYLDEPASAGTFDAPLFARVNECLAN